MADDAVSLVTDAPADRDLLDYHAYRDAIVAMIRGLTDSQLLTIGVFGDWGSGKTTLLRMVRQTLRERRIPSIWVNVWQFENEEEVWNAFLQALLINVKREISPLRRVLFNAGLLRKNIRWKQVLAALPGLLARVTIVCVPLYFSLQKIDLDELVTSQNAIAGGGTLLGTLLGWFLLARPYAQAVRERVDIDLGDFVRSAPLKSRVTRLQVFREYFQDMVTSLVGSRGRLVIFVDDLDRCSAENVVGVLDAIKLFVEIPNCVYVLGLDRGVVEAAVRRKYVDQDNAASQAREYLEKLIGLPFDLPPLSGEEMAQLVGGIASDLPEAERSAPVFALGQQPNPRKVKRAINMFLLLWTLSQQRGELGNVIKPVRLAKIVVLQHSYREFYDVVAERPEALGLLESYFRDPDGFRVEGESTDETEAESEESARKTLPGYLSAFANDARLRLLLTLHDADEQDANFTERVGEAFESLPADELRAYTQLTYAIDRVASHEPTTAEGVPGDGLVYISYRRSDSGAFAARIFDHLGARLGRERLFMDIDSIAPGMDFRAATREAIARASVLLVVIGRDWMAVDEKGVPRIAEPDDFVHMDIVEAIGLDVPIIPLLIDGASMPREEDLPEDIRALARRNAVGVRLEQFASDMDRLVGYISSLPSRG